jgi:hypothetical protein
MKRVPLKPLEVDEYIENRLGIVAAHCRMEYGTPGGYVAISSKWNGLGNGIVSEPSTRSSSGEPT